MDNALVYEWLKYADTDLDTADFLFENMKPAPYNIICYHCQQAAEKLLKSVLVVFDVPMEKTHDLGALAERCCEFIEIDEAHLDICDMLTQFGIKTRYPFESEITEEHARESLENTHELSVYLKEKISTCLTNE